MGDSVASLDIVDSAHVVIRNRADMYGGPAPRGPRFAGALMKALIDGGDVPPTVRRVGDWWVVACGRDWLAQGDGDRSIGWDRIVPTTERHGMRSEVVLRALCRGLVTATAQGRETVSDVAPSPQVALCMDACLREHAGGRVVAFCAE